MLQPNVLPPRLSPVYRKLYDAFMLMVVVANLALAGVFTAVQAGIAPAKPIVVDVPAAEDLHLGYHGYDTGTVQFSNLRVYDGATELWRINADQQLIFIAN